MYWPATVEQRLMTDNRQKRQHINAFIDARWLWAISLFILLQAAHPSHNSKQILKLVCAAAGPPPPQSHLLHLPKTDNVLPKMLLKLIFIYWGQDSLCLWFLEVFQRGLELLLIYIFYIWNIPCQVSSKSSTSKTITDRRVWYLCGCLLTRFFFWNMFQPKWWLLVLTWWCFTCILSNQEKNLSWSSSSIPSPSSSPSHFYPCPLW